MSDQESAAERAERYRKMADEAEEFARTSKFDATRIEYLKLARAWRALADSAERHD
jgi:hypothetical protein